MTARRTLLVALAAALAATSLYLTLTRWVAGDLATLAREVGREEALARQLAATWQVSEGKRRVVAELIAGRVTLRQAAGWFRELDAWLDGDPRAGRPSRVASDEEALCRMVYSWAVTDLRDKPGSSAVLARLAAEYRQQFGHDPQPLPGYAPPLPLPPPRGPQVRPPPGRLLPGRVPPLWSWAGLRHKPYGSSS
jgi:hypothetical protein